MAVPLQVIEGAAMLTAGLGGAIALSARTAYLRRPKETPNVYGDARFMNDEEIRQSGLLVNTQPADADGVYIGVWKDKRGRLNYLRDVSNGHVLICGPTRSGKGISCILPTLLSWRGSVIINDEKGELWAQTAAWRQKHIGPVIRWEPAAIADTASWNSFSEIRLLTPYEIADAQNAALMLIDIRGHGLDRLDHWQKAAVPVLAGCVLHELYLARAQGRTASLSEIAAWFSDPSSSADDLWEEMRDNTHVGGEPFSATVMGPGLPSPHLVIAAAGRSQMDRSDRERSGVTSTLLTHLTLYFDQIVVANTSFDDFSLADIADGPAPVTVYITTLPNDTVRLRPLVRLFLTTAMRFLMAPRLIYNDGQPTSPHRHKTLICADEFSSFGKLEEAEASLARCAGWGVKFLIGVQDLTQLDGIYGRGHSLLANLHTKAFFPTGDLSTAETLSKSTGTMTAQTPHTTIMGKRFGLLSQVTKSIQPTARALMTPGEVLAMRGATKDMNGRVTEPGDVLILMTGHRPLRTEQLLYFQDPEFLARSQTVPLLALPPPALAPPLLLPWIPAMPAP